MSKRKRLPKEIKIDGITYRVQNAEKMTFKGAIALCRERCLVYKTLAYGVSAQECPYTHLCMGHLNPWGTSIYFVMPSSNQHSKKQ